MDIWSRLGTIRGRIKITQKPYDFPGFSHSGPCLKGCSGIIELFFVITQAQTARKRHLRGVLGLLEALWGPPGGNSEPLLDAHCGHLRQSWSRRGPDLGPCWVILGCLGAILSPLGAMFGRFWGSPRIFGGHSGAMRRAQQITQKPLFFQ